MINAMSVDMLFDYFAMTLNGPKAEGKEITINWTFTDTNEKYVLFLKNSALNHSAGKHHENADATITVKRTTLDEIIAGKKNMKIAVLLGEIKIEGSDKTVKGLFELMDKFEFWFPIVTP
jgi:alkyl sulfatase BDS1-like metallo-beta-lactamase superfamily hydrolase